MIFTPPRFVVVDDDAQHLDAILNVFQELGSPCLGVTYEPEKGLDKTNFKGVRALFLDLHLIDHTPTTDDKQHFAHIAGLLVDHISPTGGPFVLVVWTAYPQSVRQLTDYLDESIEPVNLYARPLAVVGLPKDQFITLDTGKPLVGKADALREEVAAKVKDIPQLAALLSWESDVQAAAGETLATLLELVPAENQRSARFADGLGDVLGRLADAAVGKHVTANPRAAITSALAPILADRIVNQQGSEAASEAWGRAITGRGDTPLDPTSSGRVNRMLHVAVPPTEMINSVDWGAVVEFPGVWWNDEEMATHFGVTQCELLEREYKLKKGVGSRCRPRLVRIGAACDYAQDKSGPLTYLLGLELPTDVKNLSNFNKRKSLPMSVWFSPILATESDQAPFVLAVNARYAVNVVQATAEAWQPIYRLREQLLMHLIAHAGSYLTRPGIVSL